MPEFRSLHRQVQDEVLAVAHLLKQFGPLLGRPRVDTLNGSRHANMKEQRSDLLLSTLRRTVEAMGGNLSIIATFQDRPPVELSGIADRETSD